MSYYKYQHDINLQVYLMEDQKKKAFKEMYKSGIRGSYFGTMVNNPQFVKKSNFQRTMILQQEQQIDENTFRLVRNFKRPDETFSVYQTSGRCFLEKEGFFSCFGSRKVYDIRLRNSKLSITYQDSIARYVDFNAVSANVSSSNDSFTIAFQDSKSQIYIEPVGKKEKSKEQQTSEWMKALAQVVKMTDGRKNAYTYLARNVPSFYRFEHLLNEDFQRSATSGDVLLFKSQHSAAAIQRTFTNSEYDHVGVVLRNSKNQIFIYESSSNEGVGLTPWKHMVKYQWFNQTDKICWRPLSLEIGNKEIEIIEAFVVKTLGKGFELSLQKLFQMKSKLQRTQEEEEKKTYFCSELVARLYKELGIISEQKSSTSYYPVDFSSAGQIKFTKPGVSLGNEKIICFDGLKR